MDPQTPVSQVPDSTQPQAPPLPNLPALPAEPLVPEVPQQSQPEEQPQPASAEPVEGLVSQIVTAINNGKNMLVTVGGNPSVDELASALGLTIILGKIGKHATAVFSGKIPAAMEFLDPEKTFENTVDSLRDFIIALDREKADKLRYKVEDDVVKIFITPYKTVITQKDLQFSQGDFNVDVVLALGALNRDELDRAITAHGRILHDATVVSINAGVQKSNLGSINWNDGEASSVAEMLLSLVDQLDAQLLDAQSATAFLTGIVAETSRFSNEKTSPKVMTLAAQLMAAGANQQLIASNLRQEGVLSESIRNKPKDQPQDDSGEMVLEHNEQKDSKKDGRDSRKGAKNNQPGKNAQGNNGGQQNQSSKDQQQPAKVKQQDQDNKPAQTDVSLKLALDKQKNSESPATQPQKPTAKREETVKDTAAANPPAPVEIPVPVAPPVAEAAAPDGLPSITPPPARDALTPPQFGGTLNATQAGDEAASSTTALESESNTPPTLEHTNDGVIGSEETIEAARKAVEDAAVDPPHKRLESIGSTPLPEVAPLEASPETPPVVAPITPPSPEPVVPEAFPAPTITDVALPSQPEPMLPPAPVGDFSPPPLGPAPATAASFAPPITPPLPPQDQTAGLPPLPPLPGASADQQGLPPLPPLPGSQPITDIATGFQPQTNPEFMQNMPQSQNTWTQAGDDLAAQQNQADVDRQAKIDAKVADYEQAVDRNRELQGQSPLNNPNGSGLPPLPPV
ncbi:MAG: hypothetical protein U0520_01475 [Candidatus Saccharimonadales bacterium]